MDTLTFGAGMAKASTYMKQQHAQAELFWTLAAKALATQLKKTWLAYLDKHGVEEVEEDFIERYRQMVLGARRSEEAFFDWVQERVEADLPLIDYIKAR